MEPEEHAAMARMKSARSPGDFIRPVIEQDARRDAYVRWPRNAAPLVERAVLPMRAMKRRALFLLCMLSSIAAAPLQACGQPSPAGSSAFDSGADVTAADVSAASEAGPGDAGFSDTAATDAPATDAFLVADHRAFPQVPKISKTMTAPKLVTIVASNDAPTDGSDTAQALQAFSDVVPGSQLWSAVSGEYGLGALSSVAHLTGPALAAGSYSTAQVQAYVTSALGADAGGPSPAGNLVYLLYLPAGATFSGTTDCGYHVGYPTSTTSNGDQIAVVRRCAPDPDQETQLGQLTRVATHEIVEAATDSLGEGYNLGEPTAQPWTTSVWQQWVPAGHVELGDLCEGTRSFEPFDGGPDGGWEVQRIWSNAAAAAGGDPCVPPAAKPYESVSVPQDWYSVSPGGQVAIPIVGWSAAATSEWLLSVHVAATNDGGPFGAAGTTLDAGLTTSAGLGTVGTCSPRYGANNGTTGSLRISAPASAKSGDYVVLSVHSFREKPPPSCYPPITEDEYHFWLVGVHVP